MFRRNSPDRGCVRAFTRATRGEIIGQRVGGEQTDEAEHFIKYPSCGGYVDMCDLVQ